MATPEYKSAAFWPDVLVFSDDHLRTQFEKLERLKFTEHNVAGNTFSGVPHQWHIFSVVLRKK